MSAECGKCGFDIVYPPGTWPVGVCWNCEQANEIERLRKAATQVLDAFARTGMEPESEQFKALVALREAI